MRTGGDEVVAASWPAAAEAGRLLAALGYDVREDTGSAAALSRGSLGVHRPQSSGSQDWAESGAMVLTGRSDGPPLVAAGSPATVARAAAMAFELLTGVWVDGAALLGERAALVGLWRAGRQSCGRGTRLLRSQDGWWALNLARDADLVGVLTDSDVAEAASATERWAAAEAWGRRRPTAEIIARCNLLGLAAAALGEVPAPTSPWRIERRPARLSDVAARPLVVGFGALWAGPLAAHLLALAGADVVHVESTIRPDPTAASTPGFYELLRSGGSVRHIDFGDREALRVLMAAADVVIEASRPRAFRDLEIAADDILGDGRRRVWLRITGHPDPNRVAFGDDAAVAGGLVASDGPEPVFAGDAIADPMTGLLGALAIAAAWESPGTSIVDITLAGVAAYCAARATGEPAASATPQAPHVARRVPMLSFEVSHR